MAWRSFVVASAMVAFAYSTAFAGANDAEIGTAPAAGLTNQQAIDTFGGALMDCLQSRVNGQSISDLRNSTAIGVKAATAGDRWLAGPSTPADTPVWITDQLGNLLAISEPSPDRCEVHAVQLPVDRTFQFVIGALQQIRPDFRQVHVDPGYNPIVYQLESVVGGTRYVIHMEGAEPGLPGHALRFSLLYAYVTREPASAGSQEGSAPPK